MKRGTLAAALALALPGAAWAASPRLYRGSPEELARALGVKSLEPSRRALSDEQYARIEAALGRKPSRAEGGETFHRALDKAGAAAGVAHAAPVSSASEGGAEVAVLVSTDGYVMKAALLGAPPPGADASALAALKRKRFDELAAGSALLDAAREGVLKIYSGYFGAQDFLSVPYAQKNDLMPLVPDGHYETLEGLMEIMMVNYKASWFHLKRGNFGFIEAAASHMAALSNQVSSHEPKQNKHRAAEYDAEIEKMKASARRFAENLRQQDRARSSRDLLDVYHVCQTCHETFAPEENAEKRKYAPEM